MKLAAVHLSPATFGAPAAVASAKACLLKQHSSPLFMASAVLALSTFGIVLEKRTQVGKALSAPLVTMAAAIIMSNIGVMPFSSPCYDFINGIVVPMSIPLLLYDSDVRRIVRSAGPVLAAFAVGSLATVLSTVLAFALIKLKALGPDGWRIASALCARHIGGAINFVAVAESLGVSKSAYVPAIAADNVVVAIYFLWLFVSSGLFFKSRGKLVARGQADAVAVTISRRGKVDAPVAQDDSSRVSLTEISLALTLSAFMCWLGRVLTPRGFSALPLISTLTVAGSTAFPRLFRKVSDAGAVMGILFIQLFFAATGAAGSVVEVVRNAPVLFLFSATQIALHYCVLMAVGSRLKIGGREVRVC